MVEIPSEYYKDRDSNVFRILYEAIVLFEHETKGFSKTVLSDGVLNFVSFLT